MKLDLFDDIEGMIFRDREAPSCPAAKNNRPVSTDTYFRENAPLAMAYVPFQQWGETYGEDEALAKGTLFPPLDLPFTGGGDNR